MGPDTIPASAVSSLDLAHDKSLRDMVKKSLKLLSHSANCRVKCGNICCYKMKQIFKHSKKCTNRLSGGCPVCKKFVVLCVVHTHCCTAEECSVPYCGFIKVKYQLFKQMQFQRRLNRLHLVRAEVGVLRSKLAIALLSSGMNFEPISNSTQTE